MHIVDQVLVDDGFVRKSKRGRIENRPLPWLVIGPALIIPTQFESRHDVMESAPDANTIAKSRSGSNMYVAETVLQVDHLAA